MTGHDRLVENYEDAFFALMMEEVMLREGERLEALNQKLLADPAAAVPESLDRRCRRAIGRYASARRRRSFFRRTGKTLRAAAVAAAVIATLFTTAFAVSEEFRTAALELVRTVTGQYTQLDIRPEPGGSREGAYFRRVEAGWLPEGFDYCGGQYDVYAEFENGQGQSLRVEVYPESLPVDFDLELRTYTYLGTVFVNGNQGRCFTKDGAVVLDSLDSGSGLYYVVRSFGGVSVDTALRVIRSVRLRPDAPYFENAEIGWLPEGFAYREGRYDWYAKFEDGAGGWLWIYLYDGAGSLHVDTADADLEEEVLINGNEGLCVVKNGYVHIVTTDLTHLLYIDVIASDTLPVDAVRKIVENIRILP